MKEKSDIKKLEEDDNLGIFPDATGFAIIAGLVLLGNAAEQVKLKIQRVLGKKS